jgi:hypothetical protein
MARVEAGPAARSAAVEIASIFTPTEWVAIGLEAAEARGDSTEARECFRAGRMYLASAERHIGSAASWRGVDAALGELAREFGDTGGEM